MNLFYICKNNKSVSCISESVTHFIYLITAFIWPGDIWLLYRSPTLITFGSLQVLLFVDLKDPEFLPCFTDLSDYVHEVFLLLLVMFFMWLQKVEQTSNQSSWSVVIHFLLQFDPDWKFTALYLFTVICTENHDHFIFFHKILPVIILLYGESVPGLSVPLQDP